MPATPLAAATRAELSVRATLPKPVQQCRRTTVARLGELVADGELRDYTVTSWAKRVPLESAEGRSERRRYETFLSWAEETGATLRPFFDTRECYSMETGEKRHELVLPAMCLELYDENDDLVTVAPHADESGTTTVADCVAALAAGGDDATDQDREPLSVETS